MENTFISFINIRLSNYITLPKYISFYNIPCIQYSVSCQTVGCFLHTKHQFRCWSRRNSVMDILLPSRRQFVPAIKGSDLLLKLFISRSSNWYKPFWKGFKRNVIPHQTQKQNSVLTLRSGSLALNVATELFMAAFSLILLAWTAVKTGAPTSRGTLMVTSVLDLWLVCASGLSEAWIRSWNSKFNKIKMINYSLACWVDSTAKIDGNIPKRTRVKLVYLISGCVVISNRFLQRDNSSSWVDVEEFLSLFIADYSIVNCVLEEKRNRAKYEQALTTKVVTVWTYW